MPIEIATGIKRGEQYVTDHTERGTLTCKTNRARRVGDGTIVRLACDRPYDDLLIAGTWAMQPAGLYHPSIPVDGPDDLSTLGEDDLLVNAAPQERTHSHGQASIETLALGDGWCVRESVIAGVDRRDYTLCFDGSGMIGGSELVIVGPAETWRRARFGKVAPDVNDPTTPHDDASE